MTGRCFPVGVPIVQARAADVAEEQAGQPWAPHARAWSSAGAVLRAHLLHPSSGCLRCPDP